MVTRVVTFFDQSRNLAVGFTYFMQSMHYAKKSKNFPILYIFQISRMRHVYEFNVNLVTQTLSPETYYSLIRNIFNIHSRIFLQLKRKTKRN